MEMYIMVSGRKGGSKVREVSAIRTEINTKENGITAKEVGLEIISGLLEIFTEEIGIKTK